MSSRRRAILLAFALASCAQGQGCGCLGAVAPLPAPLPQADVTQNGATIYLSPAGFGLLASSLPTILATVLPQGLTFSLPETPIQQGCLGSACLINETLCDPTNCPYADAATCANGCPVNAVLGNAQVAGQSPNAIDITVLLTIDASQWGLGPTGACVPVADAGVDAGVCTNVIWAEGSPLNCNVNLTVDNQPVAISLALVFDPLTQAVSILPSPPSVTLVASDFDFSQCGAGGSTVSSLLSLILPQLSTQVAGLIAGQLQSALDGIFCMQPGFYADGGCPAGTEVLTDAGGLTVCEHPAGSCVVQPNGLVGIADLGSVLAGEGAPAAPTEIELFPGEATDAGLPPIVPGIDAGLRMPVIGGFLAAAASDCVAPLGARSYAVPVDVDFDTESARLGVGIYDLAVGASQPMLQRAADQAYAAGLFCLSIGSSGGNSGGGTVLSTTELAPLFPSLEQLAPDEPITLDFHPQSPPEVSIGAGTLNADGGIENPLLLLTLPNLRVDVFAPVDDRNVRVLAFTADFSVPLGLSVASGGASLQLLVGASSQVVSNVQGEASKLLGLTAAETTTQLEKFVPVALGAATSALGALPSIALPSFLGFAPTVAAIGGIAPSGDAGFNDLGLFLNLAPSSAGGPAPNLSARLVQTWMPTLEEVGPGAVLSAWPSATFALSGASALEGSYRIDEGPFRPWVGGTQLVVSDPLLLLAGAHALDVRVREVGEAGPGAVTSFSVVSAFPAAQKAATSASPATAGAPVASGSSADGCATGQGTSAWLAIAGLLFVRRRRR